MKKKFLAIVFGILVLPFAFLLGGCGHEIVRYGSYLPDVFEAEMTETLGNSTKEWKIIHRQEEIEGQTYTLDYMAYRYNNNGAEGTWHKYIWLSTGTLESEKTFKLNDENQWERLNNDYSYRSDRSAFTHNACHPLEMHLRKDRLQDETEAYLEYTWGNGTPDLIRISNNEYHLALYMEYGGLSTIWKWEITNISYTSTSDIPYLGTLVLEEVE